MHPHPSFGNERYEVFASKKIRGGRAPKGANELAASSDAARAERSALAFRRPTAVLAPANCRSSIRAALHAMQRAGVTRALASRLSEAPRAPVVMSAGSMPGPPESGSDEPPPAGTAPRPVSRRHRLTSPYVGRDGAPVSGCGRRVKQQRNCAEAPP